MNDVRFEDYVWQCEAMVCKVANRNHLSRWPRGMTTNHDEWLRLGKMHLECKKVGKR